MFRGIIDYVGAFFRMIAPATREEFQQWQKQRQTAQQEALKEEERRDKDREEVSRNEVAKAMEEVRREQEEFEAIRQEVLAREQEQSRPFIESAKEAGRKMQEELRLQAILRGPGWIQRTWWALSDGSRWSASVMFQGIRFVMPLFVLIAWIALRFLLLVAAVFFGLFIASHPLCYLLFIFTIIILMVTDIFRN